MSFVLCWYCIELFANNENRKFVGFFMATESDRNVKYKEILNKPSTNNIRNVSEKFNE